MVRNFIRTKFHYSILVLVAVLFVTGCATLFNRSSKTIPLSSNPAGAEVWINGSLRGITPLSLDLDNHKSHTVVFRREGYRDVICQLDSKVGAGWVILDILWGGLIAVVIDASTGQWRSLRQGSCNVMLPPLSGTDWYKDRKALEERYTDFGAP